MLDDSGDDSNNDDDRPAVVRSATAADLDDVFELAWMMALTFVPERDSFAATYRHILDAPDAHLLVADVDEHVAGYLLAFEHPAFFANGPVAWVEELAVRAALRRRRVGTALMTVYEGAARSRGARLVALATTRAGRFYASLGYDDHATYYRKLLT